jgi:type 1 glutamine amidotransferase
MDALRAHLERGKPLVAIRTSSHAFEPKTKYPEGSATWPEFDVEVLGGDYQNHFGKVATFVKPTAEGLKHPILKGVAPDEIKVASSLYKSRNLADGTRTLMQGRLEPKDTVEPVAWTNTYKGGRVFYTSLGGVEDFQTPAFRLMLLNAIHWAMEREAPGKLATASK